MQGPVFCDKDWPLEARKKVIRAIPLNVYDCIQKLVIYATKSDSKEPPNFQQLIEQCIFLLSSDRKPVNALTYFKVLNVIAIAFVFDLKTLESRKFFFNRLFLGREANAAVDPASHDNRMKSMVRFTSLALQYPMPDYFNILTEWLLKEDNYIRYATAVFAEISNAYLLRPVEMELEAFVDPLEKDSFEFSALATVHFINKECVAERHYSPLIAILGKWYAKRPADYLKFYSNYQHLAMDFAMKRFPVLLEINCTNAITDDNYERLHVGVVSLIMASVTTFAETPLDLAFLKAGKPDNGLINHERLNECIFVANKYGLITV